MRLILGMISMYIMFNVFRIFSIVHKIEKYRKWFWNIFVIKKYRHFLKKIAT